MKLTDITNTLFGGVGATLLIFFTTLVISLPLGLLLTFPRMSKNKIISGVTSFFISVLRGTPLMLQLIVWFFGPYY
ncbi:MAG: ABC transporter permease subunit, partial [Lachnospiraceae bacterium]|nr:ABC transporter permease subunit [Lachnospiraceae bacterium]